MIRNQLAWMIGGAQGSGVDSAANMFARTCCFGGLLVFGKREYYSNIMGEHSYFQVRVSEKPVRSHVDTLNLLTTFDAETVVRHANEVGPDGGIIYDQDITKVDIAAIPTLEKRLLVDLSATLKGQGLGLTVQDILELARRSGVHLYPIPYNDLLSEVARLLGESKLSKLARMVNTMAVAASLSLLEFPLELLAEGIQTTFRAKPKVAEMNVTASQKAYDYVREKYERGFAFRLEKVPVAERRIYIQGYQAIALGKLLGGCRFQTYYPITPASDESEYLEDHEVLETAVAHHENPQLGEAGFLKKNGGSIAVVQTEDEIAAITMAMGAALAGARSATSTSGPGFCLMVEGLGWAGNNEVPVVVNLYQRAGPSTGLPTRHEQGDLRFTLHAGHGEFPRIVLASGDLQECFYDAARVFDYAERYQLPVIHLIDKALANSSCTYPLFDTSNVKIDRGALLSEREVEGLIEAGNQYFRFNFTKSGISPRATLGTKGATFWNTGDEHDELGHITEDPVLRTRMMEKRLKKLETAAAEIPDADKINFFGDQNADLTLVSWGSTKGAILDAMDVLQTEGIDVNFLQIRLLNPFPSRAVGNILSKSKRRIDIEMNYSAQLAGLIREHTGVSVDHYIVKYNGRPMSCEELAGAIKGVALGGGRRVVLTHGA